MSELTHFRHRKDEFFKHDSHSPLEPHQRETFSGLNYFDENPSLKLVVELDTFSQQDEIQMQTSTGTIASYLRWGKFDFEVDGEPAELTVYASPGAGGFFLPFTDATTGDETYGSGRYLEIEPMRNGKFLVDFNMAYNPYCAYNPAWTCPIPPAENKLSVPIRAGEMSFK